MISNEFLLTSLIIVLLPGTGVIYTISIGLLQGGVASLFAAIGCTAGIVPHLLASTLGLAAILHMSALAFQIIKFAGVAYMLYLAWSMWKDTGALQLDHHLNRKKAWGLVVKGFLINILNPKLSLFFMAFLPQFIEPTVNSPVYSLVVLGLVFMMITLPVFIAYGVLAHSVRLYVVKSPHVLTGMRKSFALLFAAMGAKLALSDR